MNSNSLIDILINCVNNNNFNEYAERYVNNQSKLSEQDLSRLSCQIKKLKKKEIEELKVCFAKYFPRKEDSHILYLISKTKTKTAAQIKDKQINEKIAEFYEKLNMSESK